MHVIHSFIQNWLLSACSVSVIFLNAKNVAVKERTSSCPLEIIEGRD